MKWGIYLNFPQLKIGHMMPKVPILQGGMGVGISLSKLASAVANAGGIGIISGTGISIDEMRMHIRKAKEKIRNTGYIGVNVLFAMNDFAEKMKAAIEEKVDFIISGAGISRDMYTWGKNAGIPVISIVSSAKLAKLSERLGAAAVVVEGHEAGGHLGTERPLFDILPEVVAAVEIPVIAAGGIMTGKDIARALKMGASGVQMGTRFVASNECDAPLSFKEKYINARLEDTILVKTTVGLQGRAVKNNFTKLIADNNKKIKIKKCINCLKNCSYRFCTLDSLITSMDGDCENGLIFAGARVNEVKEILPVQTIINNIMMEYRACI
ncbi:MULTISPECIES: NAD(P)H-dependent flavin oxidoreductase [Bacillus]|uniref:Probable nitronate monooxygenase n=1 Tax=Bacillus thuringiensis serovar toumanoffi TaxID=180862 RepID=A0ABD5I9X6_BACTU|nr:MULTISPECIES: nitronate monooxygenase [Bacillus cereus group]MBJ7966327.1 nitronate monooxygenase [Bacillus cereus]MBJ8002123.1 nitronate monooxygenase [Bacillus cereus]MCC2544456.1 nitronate monooxygenase [Bacillus thuringiensis]MCR6784285.1 nitronate monooxygenase [Bacillus thuringiensis]MCR6862776.1 nitronate monooxygenase [Bacillus thuringiensis]